MSPLRCFAGRAYFAGRASLVEPVETTRDHPLVEPVETTRDHPLVELISLVEPVETTRSSS